MKGSRKVDSKDIFRKIVQGDDSESRIEISVCHSEMGLLRVNLRQQSWGGGIGWFTQSTIALDPLQARRLFAMHTDLIAVLDASSIDNRSSESEECIILKFPG